MNDQSSAAGGSDVIGIGIELLNDGGLADIDLALGEQPLASVGLGLQNNGLPDADDSTIALQLDLAGADCGDIGLPGGLGIELGLNLPEIGLGGADCAPAADHGSGTLLGLQLGLSALG